jgi:lysozyme
MQTSPIGIALKKQEEGYRQFPYQDVVGKWTVGYGHLIKPGEDFSAGLSEPMATMLLIKDSAFADAIVNSEVTVELNQGEFDALSDFCYNLGDRLHGSTLLRLLNAGDQAGAEAQLTAWVYAGGRPNAGLKARRILEMGLWDKGVNG